MSTADPESSANPRLQRDPPGWLRVLTSKIGSRHIDPSVRQKRRTKFEANRHRKGEPHRVEYFHQLDDPYSHLAAQTLKPLIERYDIELVPHLIRATGGISQPEMEKLAVWARRDAELIAPHYGLSFSGNVPTVPEANHAATAARALAELDAEGFVHAAPELTDALWRGDCDALKASNRNLASQEDADRVLTEGSERLHKLGHYSGAMFYYGGEWYWGADRLLHLEKRLRDLGACKASDEPFIVPRPDIDVSGVDASALELHFYPSLNSPYTAVIYDKTVELAKACNIRFYHKPVLPMIMRGVPAPMNKMQYIVFDAHREAELLGVPFGPMCTPIGEPTRRLYSLFAWAREQGKEEALLSSGLRHAFAMGVGLHTDKGMRQVVEAAGLDWSRDSSLIGNDGWKTVTRQYQDEMIDGLGLWGVPSFRLSGPEGEPDLAVWGQDRLWLVAAEIKRRAH